MAQLDDIDFIAVRIQHVRRDPNSQLQCFAEWCNSPTSGFLAVDSIRRVEWPAVFSMAVIPCSSGICFYWNKWRKKSQEFVQISTETGKRLDESRRFRHVVRNVYTHHFDPAKLGKLVNSAPKLLHEQKPSCLPLPLFSNTSVWFFGFFLPVSCVSHVAFVYCACNT